MLDGDEGPVHLCQMPQLEDRYLCGGRQCSGATDEGLDRSAVVIGQGRGASNLRNKRRTLAKTNSLNSLQK